MILIRHHLSNSPIQGSIQNKWVISLLFLAISDLLEYNSGIMSCLRLLTQFLVTTSCLSISHYLFQNSAVLWWNLKDDGTPNPKSVHRDCPVVIGSSWSKFYDYIDCNLILLKIVVWEQGTKRKQTRKQSRMFSATF